MTGAARKEYMSEFKREAVALVLEQEFTLVGAARNLGMNPDMLRRWKRELVQWGRVSWKRPPDAGTSGVLSAQGGGTSAPNGVGHI